MFFEYRSISDLNQAIIANLDKFPHDIDLIVGIPRSGMLPANLLALYLNKPYTDIDSFVEGRIYSSGERGQFIDRSKTRKVLVVDDSISSGGAKRKAEKKLEGIKDQYELLYAVVYAKSKSAHLIDIYCEIINSERIFQWNFIHHGSIIPYSCFDIDGVLCLNPPIDDDGPIYRDYIRNAPPYLIPSVEIDTLVSCRLEKYRDITEAWLRDNGVKYKHLIMLDLKTKEERLRWNRHGEYKGEVYKNTNNILFVESSLSEAKKICEISGKQVFCTENFTMLYNNKLKEERKDRIQRQKKDIILIIKAIFAKLLRVIK